MNIWSLILGFVLGVAALKLWYFAIEHKLKFLWWQILLGIIWLIWTGMGLVFVIDSFGEYEPRAGWISLLFFGLVSVIGAVLMYRKWFTPLSREA